MIVTSITRRRSVVIPPGDPWTQQINWPFSTTVLTNTGLLVEGASNFSLQTDAGAPVSPSSVGQWNFPSGMISGAAPGNYEYNGINAVPFVANAISRQAEIALWVSSNWVNHPTGTNKVIHEFLNQANKIYFDLHGASGSSDADLIPELHIQGCIAAKRADGTTISLSGGEARLTNYLQPSAVHDRATWYEYKYQIASNTPGQTDGIVRLWQNGVLLFDGFVQFDTGNHTWDSSKWNPTWGGGGSPLGVTMQMRMDNWKISGATTRSF